MNKEILITGGAQRIGKKLVHHFHDVGWHVIFQYRSSSDSANILCRELNEKRPNSCQAIQCDFDDEKSFDEFCKNINKNAGNLCALINNASTFYPKKITEIKTEDWNKLMSSNLKTPIFLISSLAEKLKENKGHIINIADIYAEQGMSGYSIYAAAKAGLYNLTKSLARELAPKVLVNSISPGSILWDVNEPSEEKKKKILSSIPMKRLGSEKDIVMLADYLIRKNTYMTGRNISVDGGKSLG
tara:strand:+ start:666 stop:1394 length:729 start_codon:yes stop_codon:yes gene_type:complete